MNPRSYIFAGGGTGGHIFPAIAVAEELERADPAARCVFVCSDREIDRVVLESAGRRHIAAPARPFALTPIRIMKLFRRWGECVRLGRSVIRDERRGGFEPTVVATGGFVGPPIFRAARAERARVVLINLDAKPGRANVWIGRRADAALSTYPIPDRPGWTPIGPIVRGSARSPGDARACRSMLGLEPDQPVLAVLGGSQGAGTINAACVELTRRAPSPLAAWQVVHQTGEREADPVRLAYKRAGISAIVEPFFDPIGPVWGAADLVIARAGAGTVAEAWANSAPTVFMPYPFHRDGHQSANAAPLVEAGAAVIVEDAADAKINADRLSARLAELTPGGTALGRMRDSYLRLGPAEGAAAAAQAVAADAPLAATLSTLETKRL